MPLTITLTDEEAQVLLSLAGRMLHEGAAGYGGRTDPVHQDAVEAEPKSIEKARPKQSMVQGAVRSASSAAERVNKTAKTVGKRVSEASKLTPKEKEHLRAWAEAKGKWTGKRLPNSVIEEWRQKGKPKK